MLAGMIPHKNGMVVTLGSSVTWKAVCVEDDIYIHIHVYIITQYIYYYISLYIIIYHYKWLYPQYIFNIFPIRLGDVKKKPGRIPRSSHELTSQGRPSSRRIRRHQVPIWRNSHSSFWLWGEDMVIYPLVMTKHNYGKSPWKMMGKSTISMAISNSYVSLPEGNPKIWCLTLFNHNGRFFVSENGNWPTAWRFFVESMVVDHWI